MAETDTNLNQPFPTPESIGPDADDSYRELIKNCQPDALYKTAYDVLSDAFHAISRLKMFPHSYPYGAIPNALEQLGPDESAGFQSMLDLMNSINVTTTQDGYSKPARGKDVIYEILKPLPLPKKLDQ